MAKKRGIKMTNREKLNAMSNEEFIKILDCRYCIYYNSKDSAVSCRVRACTEGRLRWLESEEDK